MKESSKEALKVINLKVGRNRIEIRLGDYFYDNRACVMLNSGDGRVMSSYRTSTQQRARAKQNLNYIVLPKKLVKRMKHWEIPWQEVDRTECGKVSLKFKVTQSWVDKWFGVIGI